MEEYDVLSIKSTTFSSCDVQHFRVQYSVYVYQTKNSRGQHCRDTEIMIRDIRSVTFVLSHHRVHIQRHFDLDAPQQTFSSMYLVIDTRMPA